jgi:hypothetical protein
MYLIIKDLCLRKLSKSPAKEQGAAEHIHFCRCLQSAGLFLLIVPKVSLAPKILNGCFQVLYQMSSNVNLLLTFP